MSGLGFRRGSYRCVCRQGYYFPDTTAPHKYFNGTDLEGRTLSVRLDQYA